MEIKFPLEIKVNVNKRKTEIINYEPFVLNLKEKAENNKANIEVIKFLSKYFKNKISIIKGLKSRKKIIDLA